MGFDYSDLESCIQALGRCGAAYYMNTGENDTTRLVCYSPYVTYDYNTDQPVVHCYVYNWVDVFDKHGKFISHTPFEGLHLSELDKTI